MNEDIDLKGGQLTLTAFNMAGEILMRQGASASEYVALMTHSTKHGLGRIYCATPGLYQYNEEVVHADGSYSYRRLEAANLRSGQRLRIEVYPKSGPLAEVVSIVPSSFFYAYADGSDAQLHDSDLTITISNYTLQEAK